MSTAPTVEDDDPAIRRVDRIIRKMDRVIVLTLVAMLLIATTNGLMIGLLLGAEFGAAGGR